MTNHRATPATPVVRLLTRFRGVDPQAAEHITDGRRTIAEGIASESGHGTYDVFAVENDPTVLYVLETWASVDDARRHADLVLNNGTVDRVVPLLGERLETVTLTTVVSKRHGGEA